jgi:hypothetical protein
MAILLLIRYVLLIATRQWTVKVSLFALAAILLLSLALLSMKETRVDVPPAEIQFALWQ